LSQIDDLTVDLSMTTFGSVIVVLC